MSDETPGPGGPLFEALIVPHRSLSPRGLAVLAGVIAGLAGLTALRSWLIGAWPVLGFSVPETGLALWLLHRHARGGRASELVTLSDDTLRIVRTNPHGLRRELVLPTAWLKVLLDEEPGRVPRLILAVRNAREEIAAALGEAEKRDLAAALDAALYRARNPTFGNPQLCD